MVGMCWANWLWVFPRGGGDRYSVCHYATQRRLVGTTFNIFASGRSARLCSNGNRAHALLFGAWLVSIRLGQRLRELRWRVSCASIVSMGEMVVSHIQSPVPYGSQQRILHLPYPCRQLGAMSVLGACMDTYDGKYTVKQIWLILPRCSDGADTNKAVLLCHHPNALDALQEVEQRRRCAYGCGKLGRLHRKIFCSK